MREIEIQLWKELAAMSQHCLKHIKDWMVVAASLLDEEHDHDE